MTATGTEITPVLAFEFENTYEFNARLAATQE